MTAYFTGDYSTKRFAIVLGLVLLGLGTTVGALTAMEPKNPRSFLNYYFTLAFVVGGLYMLNAARKAKNTRLTITSEGLSYGPQSYSWDDITELGVMPGGKELYCSTRSAPFAVEFPLSRRLSARQIQELFDLLEREVVRLHTHVRLCNDNEKSNR